MKHPTQAREAAEDLDAYVLRGSDAVVETRSSVVLIDTDNPSPLFRFAARVRFGADPGAEIDAVRAWYRDRDREAFTWKLGPSTSPATLEARLREHGAHEDEAEPEHTAMVLDRPPAPVPGVEVRVVDRFDDFVTSAELLASGFGGSFTDTERAAMRAQLPQRYEAYRAAGVAQRYLAVVDGRAVAVGTAVRTSVGVVALGGGATLPEARGRGAYRALVRARWDDAVAAGTPVLVTQASGLSRPILERLGFRAVGRVVELIDTTEP
ncbi:MAG TPA: hypothetical protein VET90_00775 [Candidatus Binatus sp.]|nr:hypothetical protein [Candidatus Binatus sp.]